MYKKRKKIKLNQNEIKLLICTLQSSLDSARDMYVLSSDEEKFDALETQRNKALLINKLKQYIPTQKHS